MPVSSPSEVMKVACGSMVGMSSAFTCMNEQVRATRSIMMCFIFMPVWLLCKVNEKFLRTIYFMYFCTKIKVYKLKFRTI